MPAPFIDDGYTRTELIPQTDRHAAVRFAYRPMPAVDRHRVAVKIVSLAGHRSAGITAAVELAVAAVAARLVSWDLIGDSGTLIEISPASIAALEPALFERMSIAIAAFDDEASSEMNLREGVRLALSSPQVAFRNCDHCQMYVYDEKTGRPYQHPPHSGRLVVRPAGTCPPCRIAGVGCPKGTPENSRELSAANRAAWRHYRECRATGRFPDDPLVRRHAAIIREVEDAFERRQWT